MLAALFALLLDTLTLGWRDASGWHFWYGAGATITLLLVVLRVAPAARRFFRETQWSIPAIIVGLLVWTVGPFTVRLLSTVAWPALLGWLLLSRMRASSRAS